MAKKARLAHHEQTNVISPAAPLTRLAGAFWACVLPLLLLAACSKEPAPTLRIGVMLPLTGPDSFDASPSLRWAEDNINAAGGVAGQRLELIYRDLGKLDYVSVAGELNADPTILGVIGPTQSRHVFDVAPQFIRNQKVMISPTSTSADVYRAYAGSGFIWRVTESDMAQIKTMLLLAQDQGASRVSLITSFDPYGATFFDAFGFFATELGLEVVDVIRYDQGQGGACAEPMQRALAAEPDVLFAVATAGDDVACLAREFKRSAKVHTRMLFTDTGQTQYLIDALGADAEGMEGTSLAPDQDSGYQAAYQQHFGAPIPNFAANHYDSVMLMALALERSGGVGGAALSAALKEVVDGRGEATSWTRDGIARALALIRKGDLPDLNGATGPLQFDSERHTDLTFSTYMHWRVQNGRFVVRESFPTYETSAGTQTIRDNAIFETRASAARQQSVAAQGVERQLPPRDQLWALIVATSTGWENYRHQADALAQYQFLRERGVPDDHIVLVMADDLADAPDNAEPGVIRNAPGGDDVYADAVIDYRLTDVALSELFGDVLQGRESESLPTVLHPDADDDLYVFLVGHGGRQGLYYGVERAVDSVTDDNAVLTPEELSASLSQLSAAHGFRRTLVVVEACHGGVLGRDLVGIPGVLLLSGANAFEDSLSFNFDAEQRIWRADEFAHQFLRRARAKPDQSLGDLYGDLYLSVLGSHVSIYNGFDFGDLAAVPLAGFVSAQ